MGYFASGKDKGAAAGKRKNTDNGSWKGLLDALGCKEHSGGCC